MSLLKKALNPVFIDRLTLDGWEDILFNSPFTSHYSNSSYKEYDDSFKINLVVPGYSKDDLSITISDDILSISSKDEVIKTRYRLNINDVDVDSISAECKNGILKIEVPKVKPKIKEHTIKIK